MAGARLPFLRGHISEIENFRSTRGGSRKPPILPSRAPFLHRARLLQQLDSLEQQVAARDRSQRDEFATREVVAIRPQTGTSLNADQLDDARADVRLFGEDPATGTVLLDAPSPNLATLREKIEAFGDDAKVRVRKRRDGTVVTDPAGIPITVRSDENAVAPIETIRVATIDDLAGERLRTTPILDDLPHWFELGCRGGRRRPTQMTSESRAQIGRQLHRLGLIPGEKLYELVCPEAVYFFVRGTLPQLRALVEATDCIFELDLAPPAIRDWRLFESTVTADLSNFQITPPGPRAPSVVVLDTGVASGHPMLKNAILSPANVCAESPSPEDHHGHGTLMAGIALYRDLGAALEGNSARMDHWLHPVKLIEAPHRGNASDDHYEAWPALTAEAADVAEKADPVPRNRVFTLAITRPMQGTSASDRVSHVTLWSHAVDQIAYGDGKGRLVLVAAGNARFEQWRILAEQYPQLQLSEHVHEPAQATNAVTVGAYTRRTSLPLDADYKEAEAVAKEAGGISPFTSTGRIDTRWPIKPDILMEGGNLAISSMLTDPAVPTLAGLATSLRHKDGSPLGLLSMTSEATARAACLAAQIWDREPELRPETVRAVMVHAASWTDQMIRQFPGLDDRLAACGYGVPDQDFAMACANDRATIVVEDHMPSGVIENEPKKEPPQRKDASSTSPKLRRKAKFFRLPVPEVLLTNEDPAVELRVTLSYFAETNKFRQQTANGLDLRWDMQGPAETETQFRERINALMREVDDSGKARRKANTKGFPWDIGPQRRARGSSTVQSDRWRGRMSLLAGEKLIAVFPVLGWWDRDRDLRTEKLRFSLVVTVCGPDVYAAIRPRLTIAASVDV